MEKNVEKVIAVIVTYNRKVLLEECLESVLEQSYPVKKIILIDNASTDGTEALFAENGKFFLNQVEYHKMEENLGGSGGFYEGLKKCRECDCDWVWIMDDDTIPDNDCLEKLIGARKQITENIGFLASCIVGPEGEAMNVPNLDMTPTENGYPYWYKYLGIGCVRISAATFVSILVNYGAIKKCGLPCKDYFIWGDDIEYTQRISSKYGPCYFVGNSVAVHKRFNAKKLDIALEDNPSRMERFWLFYRNGIINVGLFYGRNKMIKAILRNYRLALRYLLKCDFLRAKIVFRGTSKAILEFGNFKDYVDAQLGRKQ